MARCVAFIPEFVLCGKRDVWDESHEKACAVNVLSLQPFSPEWGERIFCCERVILTLLVGIL